MFAVLGWAIVSFGITMANNAKDMRDLVLESSAFLVQILARYASYERIYRTGISSSDIIGHFEDAIQQVYKSILVYTVGMTNYMKENSFMHQMKGMLPVSGRSLSVQKASIEACDTVVIKWVCIDNFLCATESGLLTPEAISAQRRTS